MQAIVTITSSGFILNRKFIMEQYPVEYKSLEYTRRYNPKNFKVAVVDFIYKVDKKAYEILKQDMIKNSRLIT